LGVFQIVALNNPAGIIRSVENTNGVPLWHSCGMSKSDNLNCTLTIHLQKSVFRHRVLIAGTGKMVKERLDGL
jgi:hypothetical protein